MIVIVDMSSLTLNYLLLLMLYCSVFRQIIDRRCHGALHRWNGSGEDRSTSRDTTFEGH